MTTEVFECPPIPISTQLFHVPGGAVEGGITSGGARIRSPEPGGFGILQIELALQVNEWISPISSWLMSKVNGETLRIRLAPTPQVAYSKRRSAGFGSVSWDEGVLWADSTEWQGDYSLVFAAASLEGATTVQFDTTPLGEVVKPGHVIGHGNSTYKVDSISYDGSIATARVKPPLRRDVAIGDVLYLRPFFTGYIASASDFIKPYSASDNGHIKPGKMVLYESIV